MTMLAQLRRMVRRGGHGLNAMMRWIANRLTGGYLARLERNSLEATAAALRAARMAEALHDRFQNQTLAALVLQRMSAAQADAPEAAADGADHAALRRLLEENLAAARLLRDRLQDGSLAALVLERVGAAPGGGESEGRGPPSTP